MSRKKRRAPLTNPMTGRPYADKAAELEAHRAGDLLRRGRAVARDYELVSKDGRHIRKATEVVFLNDIGRPTNHIRFMERIPKREAVRQALRYSTDEAWR